MRLKNKVALVTGASRGIGEACARALLRRSAKVAVTARSADVLGHLEAAGAFAIRADLTDAAARRAVVERATAQFGKIDVLINNAGVGLYAPSWRAPMALVRGMFELNFFAALDLIQLVTPGLIERGGGAIVNISSIAGKVALPWLTAYSASKHALCGLGDGLRIELAPHGIHVMTVCPGYVRTRFGESGLDGAAPARLAAYQKFAVTPAECAEAVVRGIERKARTVVTPRIAWALAAARRVAPRAVDLQLARIYRDVAR
jgi:short-subunit dehydrogenase